MTTTPAAPGKRVQTPVARLSYPALFVPKVREEGQVPKYSAVLLFKKGENLDELKKMVREVGIKKWGPDQSKWPRTDGRPPRMPFREQGDKLKDGVLPPGYEAGAIFITVSTVQPPGICGPSLAPIRASSEIFAGCWVKCSVNAYAYGGPGTKFRAGISIGLNNVQLIRHDEPLGGGAIAPELEFAPVEDLPPPAAAADPNNLV